MPNRRCAWRRTALGGSALCAVFVCLGAALAGAVSDAQDTPFPLGGEKFLFLDDFLLETVENARLTVHPPRFDALVLIADQPWESGGITSYGNVLWDPSTEEYRLYYVPVCWEVSPGFCLALAISKDGIHWRKPALGMIEWKGSKDNNIVIWGQREGTVFVDPNAAPDRRYAFISSEPNLKTRLFTSPDGIRFTMQDILISSHHSDSQISSFWDASAGRYFHYPRVIHRGTRAVGLVTTASADEPWPESIPMVMAPDERDPAGLDLYTNACQRYALAKNAYVGFPTPYYHYNAEGRAYLNAPTLALGGKTNDGTIETQLATSRDGRHWTRYRTPYVPVGNYDGLEVKVAMVIPGILHEKGKLYQYFMGYTFTHGNTQVRYGKGGRELGGVFRVEQRVDGFLSLAFDYEGGAVITKPFTFSGSRLLLNIDTSASGEARVAILDAEGNALPGYGLDNARYINGDYLEKAVEWRDGQTDVSLLSGKPLRLCFACRGTHLYAFRFGK